MEKPTTSCRLIFLLFPERSVTSSAKQSACGDCDPNFPSHGWKQCPYAPHPARKNHVWPDTHSPLQIAPAQPGSVVDSSVQRGTPSRQLQTFPVRFSEPLLSAVALPYVATHEDDCFEDETEPPRVWTPFNGSYAGRTSICNRGHPLPTLTSNHIKFYLAAAAGEEVDSE